MNSYIMSVVVTPVKYFSLFCLIYIGNFAEKGIFSRWPCARKKEKN